MKNCYLKSVVAFMIGSNPAMPGLLQTCNFPVSAIALLDATSKIGYPYLVVDLAN